MGNTKRRSFLSTSLAVFPLAILGQSVQTAQADSKAQPTRVPAGSDRFGEDHTLGVSSTAFKVATNDARGGLFVMEHSNRKKGGPARHLHHNEDEWFYVIEGDYIVEVGNEQFRLKSGDSVLGPREVPHAWAFVGDTPGRLLIAFAPANKMEEYFRSLFKENGGKYSDWNSPQHRAAVRAFGLELLGPPLSLE